MAKKHSNRAQKRALLNRERQSSGQCRTLPSQNKIPKTLTTESDEAMLVNYGTNIRDDHG